MQLQTENLITSISYLENIEVCDHTSDLIVLGADPDLPNIVCRLV